MFCMRLKVWQCRRLAVRHQPLVLAEEIAPVQFISPFNLRAGEHEGVKKFVESGNIHLLATLTLPWGVEFWSLVRGGLHPGQGNS